MTNSSDVARRVQCVRLVTRRFMPIVASGLSPEWNEVVVELPAWGGLRELADRFGDADIPVGIGEVQGMLEALTELLDLFDEEPMGRGYYPFKAAELVELHCRMATGDLLDNSPVGLPEWIRRFAQHVDRQLEKSGIDLGRQDYFRELEDRFQVDRERITGRDDMTFRELMEKSKEAAVVYFDSLRSAFGDEVR